MVIKKFVNKFQNLLNLLGFLQKHTPPSAVQGFLKENMAKGILS